MSGAEYAELRRRYGSQQAAADALAVHRVTVAKRESGGMEITTEAAFALLWLVRGGAGGRKRVRAERRKAPNVEAHEPRL
jgi:hypothetical protein